MPLTQQEVLDRIAARSLPGSLPKAPFSRVTSSEPKALSDGRRGFRFCFSDGSVDRMGDTIAPTGWNTHNFLKNPVALWAHDSSSPPVGRASNIAVEGARLMGDIEFAGAEIYPFAGTIYQLVKEKFISAVSVGFLPIDWKWADDEDEDRRWGIDFKRQELLEISVVPVPANANALIEARAKGIDVRPVVRWAEKLLDAGGQVSVPRSELEYLRQAALEAVALRSLGRPKRKLLPVWSCGHLGHEHPSKQEAMDCIKAGDGMSETDPSGGGDLVDCGKDADEPCGLDDPSKCMIHGDHNKSEDEDDDMDEKAIVALVTRTTERVIERVLPRAIKAALAAPETRDDDDYPAGEHVEHMKTAHFHAKECAKCIRKALDSANEGDNPDVGDEEHETDKAARAALVASLRAA